MCTLLDAFEKEGLEKGLKKGIEQGIKQGVREGSITTLYGLYSDGDITLQRAAAKAGMPEAAFLETAKKYM